MHCHNVTFHESLYFVTREENGVPNTVFASADTDKAL
jgi:hypothetical protein